MTVLKPSADSIIKVLGLQKIKDTKYRKALWIIEDGNIIHNTLTCEVMLLDGSETKDELIKRRYLVPIELDEIKFIKEWRTVLQLMLMPGQKYSYTILPTTACNARCFYCYEKGIQFHTMSDKTVKQVIEKISSEQKQKVSLRWFGGEPLVGIKQIDAICTGLKDKGLEITSKMISNGYLFDKNNVERAVNLWNLKEVQITLDGTEENYNSIKNYINPVENPFKRVMRNITLLNEAGIKVIVRLNVGSHNYDDLKNLIPLLEKIKNKNLSVYSKALFQENNEENDIRCAELMDMLAEKGLRKNGRQLSKIRINACMADNDNSIIIDPLGGLSKCEHYVFSGSVGSIEKSMDSEKIKFWKEYSVPEFCRSCPLIPSCILLDGCPESRPCSDCKRNYRIEQTKVSMRMLCDNKETGVSDESEDSGLEC